jgi:Spy/CpxP family protein refolding chaperone
MTLSSGVLLAQQATTPAPETPNTATAATAPRLTLEQKKQIREMRMAARDQAAIIHHDQTLTPEQKQAKLKELRASTRAQMKSVLTPEQQKAFAERGAAGKARFEAKLGLTPDQSSKMKELFSSTHQQRQAVLTDSALTNEQKQAKLSQIRQASKAQLATILTPDQLEKLQQMRKMHHHPKMG